MTPSIAQLKAESLLVGTYQGYEDAKIGTNLHSKDNSKKCQQTPFLINYMNDMHEFPTLSRRIECQSGKYIGHSSRVWRNSLCRRFLQACQTITRIPSWDIMPATRKVQDKWNILVFNVSIVFRGLGLDQPQRQEIRILRSISLQRQKWLVLLKTL